MPVHWCFNNNFSIYKAGNEMSICASTESTLKTLEYFLMGSRLQARNNFVYCVRVKQHQSGPLGA